MRILAFFEICALVAGAIAVAAGWLWSIRDGLHLGIFLIGAGISLGGLDSAFTRKPAFFSSDAAREAYYGFPALVWATVLLITGTAVIAAAYLLHDGRWGETVEFLTRRPGPLLGAGGVIAICIGILLTLNPRGRRGVAWALFVRLPKMLLGLLLAIAGAAAIVLGTWDWMEPRAFERISRGLWARFDPQALARIWKDLSRFSR